jgi:23S rRNA U2552 (ribose-2'-O)-methylase RlmE/FtsJ
MIYFLLPSSFLFTYKNIEYQSYNEFPEPVISLSIASYLYEIKEKINDYGEEWDIYKKYTNPYEYIHTIIPSYKKTISKYKPLSRSFFKMIEILFTFSFYFENNHIRSFHLAEGPGGFIEAIFHYRNNPNDEYYGMTLHNKNDRNVPTWKKETKIMKNKNIIIENGADGTGNILSIGNFQHCYKKYGSSMDFITADGGFDFSTEFNKQETNIGKLLYAQVFYAISMQKYGGSFVLKIFDSFMQHTIDILYLLSSFYKKVYITKPHTSRYANSEKYIICNHFMFSQTSVIYPYLLKGFQDMMDSGDQYIGRLLNKSIPQYFITKLEEYNCIFGEQQIYNIYYTLSLIETKKTDKIENLIKTNIQKSISWCERHNIVSNF